MTRSCIGCLFGCLFARLPACSLAYLLASPLSRLPASCGTGEVKGAVEFEDGTGHFYRCVYDDGDEEELPAGDLLKELALQGLPVISNGTSVGGGEKGIDGGSDGGGSSGGGCSGG